MTSSHTEFGARHPESWKRAFSALFSHPHKIPGSPLSSESRVSNSFLVVDARTGEPLGGCAFLLLKEGREIASARSDGMGRVCFTPPEPGEYGLRQTAFPDGYMGLSMTASVTLHPDGRVTVAGEPFRDYRALDFERRNG